MEISGRLVMREDEESYILVPIPRISEEDVLQSFTGDSVRDLEVHYEYLMGNSRVAKEISYYAFSVMYLPTGYNKIQSRLFKVPQDIVLNTMLSTPPPGNVGPHNTHDILVDPACIDMFAAVFQYKSSLIRIGTGTFIPHVAESGSYFKYRATDIIGIVAIEYYMTECEKKN